MKIGFRKSQAGLLVCLSVLLVLSACRSSGPVQTQGTAPVMIITQVVNQVVTATFAPTATLVPSPTPVPSLTPTPTFDPYSAPVYYPLKDCVASRLHQGDVARVAPGGTANGIRYGLDLYVDTIIYSAKQGELLDIVGGPFCSRGWIVWQVKTSSGVIGFTPEGNGYEYWLLPTGP